MPSLVVAAGGVVVVVAVADAAVAVAVVADAAVVDVADVDAAVAQISPGAWQGRTSTSEPRMEAIDSSRMVEAVDYQMLMASLCYCASENLMMMVRTLLEGEKEDLGLDPMVVASYQIPLPAV